MLGQQNILVIWHLFGSFPNKFVMYGVTIETPIESFMYDKSHDPKLIR